MTNKIEKKSDSREWFAATLLFCSSIRGSPNLRPLCEERVVLFRGGSEGLVLEQATSYGKAEEHEYKNVYGEQVKWHFVRLEKFERIDPPPTESGWEVNSRFVRRSLATIRRKGAHL